jgi:hypothetical protein
MSDVKEVDEKSIATEGFMQEVEDALGDTSDSAVDPWMCVSIIDARTKLASSSALPDPEHARGPPIASGVLRHVIAAKRAARLWAEERMRGAFQSS